MSEPLIGHHTDTGSGSHGKPSSKADKRKQTIIAVTAVIGVLLTYLLWRRSTSSSVSASSPAAATPTADGVSSGGTSAGADYSGALNALGSELSQLQTSVGTLTDANSSLQSQLTATQNRLQSTTTGQGAQIHHLAGVIQHNEALTTAQLTKKNKQIVSLNKQIHVLKQNQAGAHKATSHHKKSPAKGKAKK
jgi:hypothetical protein